jgi:peroxiredoxin
MNRLIGIGGGLLAGLLMLTALGCDNGESKTKGSAKAPEIKGADQDGVEFALSDYRGKAVMLDFWAQWCGYCVAMYPHERELVTKMKDRPFALLGVNVDASRKKFREVMQENDLTWRAWWDDPSQGLIVEQYRVEAYPTILLIDHTGRIRKRWDGAPQDVADLDKAIEALVKEAEKERGN